MPQLNLRMNVANVSSKKDELPNKMDLDKGVDMDQQLNTEQQIQISRPSNIYDVVAQKRLALIKQDASVENPAKTTGRMLPTP